MQAAAVADAVASVTHTGTIDTTGEQGGAVTLQADHGIIKATGKIKANSKNAKNKGGDIIIGRDDKVDPITGKTTTVLAKATDVRGATLESQGGFVETSGEYLETEAITVKAKDWLLDPTNIRIVSSDRNDFPNTPSDPSALPSAGSTQTFQDTSAVPESEILNTTINTALNAGVNVKISTGLGTSSAGTQDGNIIVDAAITKSTGVDAKLTLEANNGITVNSSITGSSSNGKLDVELIANGNATNSNNSQGITFNGAGVINTNGNVKITSTSKFTNSWNYQRSALAMAAGSKIIGKDLDFKLTAAPATGNRVFGIYAENNTTLQATGGNLVIDATVQGAGTFVTGGTTYSAAGIYLGSGTGAKSLVSATGNVTLKTDASAASNVDTTYGISIRDTKVSAGGIITIDAKVKDASVAAITTGNGGSGLGADFVADGDVSITSDKGAINISGLTVSGGGLQGKKVTINNGTTGATGSNGGIAISGAGNITATDAIEIIGKSVNGNAVQISNSVTGKSIKIQGDASGNGRGIGGIGALKATNGGVTVVGTSVNEAGANINSSITATGDITVTGKSTNWHGLFSNGTINSTEGNITFSGQNDNGAGLGMGGGGSMTAKGDISVTGKSKGYFGIGGNGAITSTYGKVALLGTSDQSVGIVLNNKITAKNGTVELTGTGGNNKGISITGGSTAAPVGIEAASYTVKGTSTASDGVNLDGTATFKSTDTTTESVIDGKGSRGIYIYRSALTIDSGNGKATMKGSSGGVGLGSDQRPTVNTKGDVTIGSHDSNARLAIQRAKISAEGKLALLGQSGGDGITMQDGSGDNVAIVGKNGAQITIDGKSTGSGVGVNMAIGNSNIKHEVSTTGVTTTGEKGSITINGESTNGTAVNARQAQISGETINFNTNTLNIEAGAKINAGTTGTVNIKTKDAGKEIQLGASDVTSSAGQKLGLSNAELDSITAKNLVIGDTSSNGKITVAAAITTAASNGDLTLQTGGDIEFKQGLTVGGSTAANKLTLKAGGKVTQNATAAIRATELQLLGTNAEYKLNSTTNSVGKIAGSAKIIEYTNAGALSIDTVVGTTETSQGIQTTAGLNVTTQTLNLNINEAVENMTTGDIILGAGIKHGVNGNTWENIQTTDGKTVKNNADGQKTYLYTGNANNSGKLSHLDSSLTNLDFSEFDSAIGVNAESKVAYNAGAGIADSTAKVQVMFRSQVSFDAPTNGATLTKTYGDSNTGSTTPEKAQLLAEAKVKLKESNQVNGSPSVIERTTDAGNKLRISSSALIDSLDSSPALNGASYSNSDKLKASDTTYKYGELTSSKYTTTVAADKLEVKVNKLALTGSIAQSTTTYGDPLAAGTVNLSGKVGTDVVDANGVTFNTAGLTSTSGNLKAGTHADVQSVTALSGTDKDNYTFADVKGDYKVNQKPLTALYAANNKEFDGNTNAVVAATLKDIIAGDKVTANHTGAKFASPNVGTNISVTVEGISLVGADASNYKVNPATNPGNKATSSANITARPPTPPTPVVPTNNAGARVKVPVGSANPFALASAEDLADDTCSANSVENCYCEESAVSQGVDICYEPKTAAKGLIR